MNTFNIYRAKLGAFICRYPFGVLILFILIAKLMGYVEFWIHPIAALLLGILALWVALKNVLVSVRVKRDEVNKEVKINIDTGESQDESVR